MGIEIVTIPKKYVFVQDTEPTGVSEGALWYKTSTKVLYKYDGSSWIDISVLGTSIETAEITDGAVTPAKLDRGYLSAPIAYSAWKFNNDATDENAHFNLTVNGGTFETAQKKEGTHSYLTNAAGENATHATFLDAAHTDYSATGFAFTGWIRFNATGTTQYIITKSNTGAPNNRIEFAVLDTNKWAVYYSVGSDANIQSTDTIATNVWYFFCINFFPNGDFELWVNNIKVNCDYTTFSDVMADGTVADFTISQSDTANYYLDDVRFFDRALYPFEIISLYVS